MTESKALPGIAEFDLRNIETAAATDPDKVKALSMVAEVMVVYGRERGSKAALELLVSAFLSTALSLGHDQACAETMLRWAADILPESYAKAGLARAPKGEA